MATRGIGRLKAERRQDEISRIAHAGGVSSPTKFKKGDARTKAAGKKGGKARAHDPDVTSGALGQMGAAARWHKKENIEDLVG